MASLPFPLDLDFIFTGPYMMIEGAICNGRGPYVMASLPTPLDLDFIFTGPYMMIEGGHM